MNESFTCDNCGSPQYRGILSAQHRPFRDFNCLLPELIGYRFEECSTISL